MYVAAHTKLKTTKRPSTAHRIAGGASKGQACQKPLPEFIRRCQSTAKRTLPWACSHHKHDLQPVAAQNHRKRNKLHKNLQGGCAQLRNVCLHASDRRGCPENSTAEKKLSIDTAPVAVLLNCSYSEIRVPGPFVRRLLNSKPTMLQTIENS